MTHPFTCPHCGGHHFGRDVAKIDGEIQTLATVRCHNADDGTPMVGWTQRTEEGLPKQRPCGWRVKHERICCLVCPRFLRGNHCAECALGIDEKTIA